jgi:hypothetical protein
MFSICKQSNDVRSPRPASGTRHSQARLPPRLLYVPDMAALAVQHACLSTRSTCCSTPHTLSRMQGTAATSAGADASPTQAAALPYKVLTLPRPSSNGATLKFSVVDQGTGPSTILMLHGFPDSAQVWRNQVCCNSMQTHAQQLNRLHTHSGSYVCRSICRPETETPSPLVSVSSSAACVSTTHAGASTGQGRVPRHCSRSAWLWQY